MGIYPSFMSQSQKAIIKQFACLILSLKATATLELKTSKLKSMMELTKKLHLQLRKQKITKTLSQNTTITKPSYQKSQSSVLQDLSYDSPDHGREKSSKWSQVDEKMTLKIK